MLVVNTERRNGCESQQCPCVKISPLCLEKFCAGRILSPRLLLGILGNAVIFAITINIKLSGWADCEEATASVATVASMQLLPPAPQLQLACSHSEVGACQLLPAARTHNLLDKLEWALAVPGVVLSCKPRLKLEFVITRHCPAAVSGYNECRRATGRPTLCSSSSACGDTFN